MLTAQVAKLVDALPSGGSAARCAGSNPVLGTMLYYKTTDKTTNRSVLLFLLYLFSYDKFDFHKKNIKRTKA